MTTVLDRFLRYVAYDTQSDPESKTYPSTGKQLVLLRDLADELEEKITVREEGRSRRISKQRALIKSVMAKALQGNVQATAAILALYARLIVEPADDADDQIQADELEIIKRFAPRLLKSIKRK